MDQLLAKNPDVFRRDLPVVAREIADLASYFRDDDPSATAEEIRRSFGEHQSPGWPLGWCFEFMRVQQTPRGHRQRSGRYTVMLALESRIRDKTSWTQVAEKFCDCGAKSHRDKCQDRIHLRVRGLQKFLNRLGA